MSRLLEALKANFDTPQDALRALGLNPNLLDLQAEDSAIARRRRRVRMAMDTDEAQGEGQREAEREHDKPLTTLRSAVDRWVRKHGARDDHPMVAELRKMADLHDRGSTIPPKVETMAENLTEGAEDEEEDDDEGNRPVKLNELRDSLRDGFNMAGDELDMVMDKVRRHTAGGHDRLPRPATRGGMGGHLSGRGRDKVFDDIENGMARIEPSWSTSTGPDRERDDPNNLKPKGLDSRPRRSASDAEVDKIGVLLKRFDQEPDTRQPHMVMNDRRSRQATDSKPRGSSEVREAKLFKMFPNLARVGCSPSDGGVHDPARRSLYEV